MENCMHIMISIMHTSYILMLHGNAYGSRTSFFNNTTVLQPSIDAIVARIFFTHQDILASTIINAYAQNIQVHDKCIMYKNG